MSLIQPLYRASEKLCSSFLSVVLALDRFIIINTLMFSPG